MEKNRYQILLKAIEEERKQEERYYADISAQKTIKERIDAGVLLTHLAIKKKYYTIGEHVEIQFEFTKKYDQPNKFKTGVGVQLIYESDQTYRFRGTLSYKKKNEIGIIIRTDILSKDVLNDNALYKLELIYDERPYKVMRDALNEVINSKDDIIKDLRKGITNLTALGEKRNNSETKWHIHDHLNSTQKNAINQMLEAGQMGIIHGPPGTGKTTTLVSLVYSLLQQERKILVCAPSNNAVDLLATKISEIGINVLRIGNVTRIDDNIAHLTIDEKARNHQDWNHVKQIRIEAETARKMAGTHKRKFGAKERRNRTDMYKESRELKKWAREMQDRLMSDIINQSQVIATTLIGCSQKQIQNISFDTVIIDEASQCLEPECWNAMIKAKKVIFAGDHHQLPPTVKSSEAIALGLNVTLLDRMSPVIKYKQLLDTQYRMNDQILAFSNEKFYEGLLKSDDHNKNWTLPNDSHPVTFIDTSGCGYEENFNPKSKSLSNPGEYFILREYILKHYEILKDVEIGMIAAYAEQVRYIKGQIEEDEEIRSLDMQVNSIDGFQGQEKDVIFISLTRSNELGIIGFLGDYRRLNVAMTRAKKKLVIIGDGATLCSDKLFLDLINFIEKNGKLESAWEYML